jgi:two-component system osmolarity sensor histidine kinase EnvZ
MLTNLQQAEEDRTLLLAGVSHDLRTPLARLRLGIEVGMPDDKEREGMVSDIEEMDRIIGQFLDFARGDRDTPTETRQLNDIVLPLVERGRRDGRDIVFNAGDLPPLPLRATAMSRLVGNLLDNALRYGKEPIEIATYRMGPSIVAGRVRSRAGHSG